MTHSERVVHYDKILHSLRALIDATEIRTRDYAKLADMDIIIRGLRSYSLERYDG